MLNLLNHYTKLWAYQLCACMDQTLTFSLQDQVPLGTHLGTSVQRVAWGHVEAA